MKRNFLREIRILKVLRELALSWNAPQVRLYNYFKEVPDGQPVVVSVGAMAKGPDTFADEYTDEKIGKERTCVYVWILLLIYNIGISSFALSASVACGKVCCAFEDLWDIM